ncbi:MAG: hypothetical protein JNM07_02600 [Phycisphaerae bacterium]|nr:hypothetical protein [Phycisphaerae bacterium]
MDPQNRKLIENEAKAALRRHRADPMLLPDIVARLNVYWSGKEGDPRRVMARGDSGLVTADVLMAEFRVSHPERFGTDPGEYDADATPEAREKRVAAEIQREVAKIAPGGDTMLVDPVKKLNIAREIRAKHADDEGDGPAGAPVPREPPENPPGGAVDRLKGVRRANGGVWPNGVRMTADSPHLPAPASAVDRVKLARQASLVYTPR